MKADLTSAFQAFAWLYEVYWETVGCHNFDSILLSVGKFFSYRDHFVYDAAIARWS